MRLTDQNYWNQCMKVESSYLKNYGKTINEQFIDWQTV